MRESDIRPQAVFDEFLRLARKDVASFFSEGPRDARGCPACGSTGEAAFSKSGFDYDACPDCRTLYVNPCPRPEAFSRYYLESESVRYWATTFYRETEDARREMIWKPKAQAVEALIERYAPGHSHVVDVGGGYGVFAEETERLSDRRVTVVEPSPVLGEVCRQKGLRVVPRFLEQVVAADLPAEGKTFVSFELFEHLHDPAAFLGDLFGLMASGDLFVLTTLSGSGLDIQVLWQDSDSVSPPHHLNFLNPSALDRLLVRTGFEPLEITTPGRLDIDILANRASLINDRFWRTLVETATPEERRQWQDWIARSGRSSHMMAVCRKP
jgi:hypothetical protein